MSSDSESDWSDVPNESELKEITCICLFCNESSEDAEFSLQHIKDKHDIDIKEIIRSKNMDFYLFIKFINYIRACKPSVEHVKELTLDSLNSDKWFQPVIEDDMLLQFDLDIILKEYSGDERVSCEGYLKEKLTSAEKRAKLAEDFLQRTIHDLEKCRKEMSSMLLAENKKVVAEVKAKEDDKSGYFGSYGHYSIHEEMLKDKVRTEVYRNFIFKNTNIFGGAKVLDVGCGTSVLSLFAAKAGASEVTGVDFSEVAYNAMDIVKENGFENTIQITKGRAEDLKLNEKVDVIISEWMGYFLLFESMLDTVIYCRDHYLQPEGCIYPNKCNIKLSALDDKELYQSKVGFWNDVYGFKMSVMKRDVMEEPLVDIVKPIHIISKSSILVEFDLMKVSVADLNLDEGFELEFNRDGVLSAIVGYFDVDFNNNSEHPISMTTSPHASPTHWKQTVFFLKKSFPVKSGDTMLGRLICKKNKKDHRALDIAIIIYGGENDKDVLLRQHYVMS